MKSILSSISKPSRYILAWVILFSCQYVLAERCEPQENNEYEKILCQLKQSGRGAGLPNIYQFRENSPLIQALLLKKTAERAGITVKIPERDNQETLRRQEELLVSSSSVQDAAKQAEGPRSLNSAVRTVAIIQQAPPAKAVDTSPEPTGENVKSAETENKTADLPVKSNVESTIMTGCSFQQLTIQCANGRYQLIGNKTNQQLPANALADDQKLSLPTYMGAADDTAALDDYLAKAYDRYLGGMTAIGLGASTMSYTKFANLYQYIVGQHLNFADRFETMYQFLKKDKAEIGVSTKLSIAEGFTLQSCNELENFIACDYQKINYVFTKTTSAGAP